MWNKWIDSLTYGTFVLEGLPKSLSNARPCKAHSPRHTLFTKVQAHRSLQATVPGRFAWSLAAGKEARWFWSGLEMLLGRPIARACTSLSPLQSLEKVTIKLGTWEPVFFKAMETGFELSFATFCFLCYYNQ